MKRLLPLLFLLASTGCSDSLEAGDYRVYRLAFADTVQNAGCFAKSQIPDEIEGDSSTFRAGQTIAILIGAGDAAYLDLGGSSLEGLFNEGGFSFAGLGLLIASRPRTTEGVAGLMNLVLLPMWLLGGSFFSNERFPAGLQPVVKALPLTHLNDALRENMLGAAGIGETWGALLFLLAFGVVCFALALRVFRWS